MLTAGPLLEDGYARPITNPRVFADMSENKPALPERLTGVVQAVCFGLAILGGLVLVAVTLITDTSILGRALIPLGLRPIHGDFEMVELGIGFAIFSFMPWCQFNRGHATVDIFTSWLPPRALHFLDLLIDIAFAVVITVVVWRMGVGLSGKMANGQQTFILQMPVWWTYAGGMVGGIAWVGVSLYCVIESAAALVTGRDRRESERLEV